MSGNDPFHEAPEEGHSSRGRNVPTARTDESLAATESGVFRTTFDQRTESAGMVVVSAVAAVSNTDPNEMEPIHSVVDTDALNALFQPGWDGQVTFPFCGHEVTVRSDGELTVTPDRD